MSTWVSRIARPGGRSTEDADAFEQSDGGIIQVDARTGEQRTVASGGSFNSPVALAIAASGKLAVVDYEGLIVVDPATGTQSLMPWSEGIGRPWGIAIVP